MRILNLCSLEESQIKYKISAFPDGQNNIDIIDFTEVHVPVVIHIRLRNFWDVEQLICAVKSLRGLVINDISLYCPWVLGTRSDRKFVTGGNNYIKDVIAPIINSLNFTSVTILDPHSDVLEACINNFKSEDNQRLATFALNDISSDNCIMVVPDGGALKKAYKLASSLDIPNKDIITCSKSRDTEGKLTKTEMPKLKRLDADYIIVDDILDGGRTFIEIAKIIKGYYDFEGRIFLVITHGIFSQGFHELRKYFDGIYCTNSYQDIDLNYAYSFGKSTWEYDPTLKDFVKQLKVI